MAVGSEPEPSESLQGFGALLALFRKRAGLTQEQFAPLVGYSAAAVSSIEQGRRFPQRQFILQADQILEADEVLKTSGRHLARRPGIASWFRHWAQLEEEALNLWTYECRVVPGLLQSEAYARAVFQSRMPPLADAQVENQVSARMDRQHLLRENPNTAYSFIVEEAVILRRTGGVEVTRGLIDHMLAQADLRNVELQVMPLRQEDHAGLGGPLQLLETPDNQWLGYTEGYFNSHLTSSPKQVGRMLQRYARMRSQALTSADSVGLLKRLRGDL
ncbi:helix-turn-helix transcriptional regulator [Streptomyces sp. ACA25]|uniref:helix-turn-helix domain-containing protein n=1 Tax=Streptomyces sp. ACA25 TaxID=3022596 RepID=UPI00230817B8|nr:helix-turn-helix transcriptional regulator [Streptomyces sp. ACA25]MDB1088525.1 helix-turn-helix transcriptional regulator [Streptomyces sp. ACA25]